MKYRSYSHISICLLSLYFLWPFLFLLTSFTPSLFPVSSPPFSLSFAILTVRRGCFTPNTSFPLLSSPFFSSLFLLLSFPSPLFPLSFLLFLPFLSLSLQIFGAATAAMLHHFRRAWIQWFAPEDLRVLP